MQRFPQLRIFLLAVLVSAAFVAHSQSQAPPASPSPQMGRRLLLVLPFENHTGQPSLGWIGEAVPEILNQRLASAGFMVISREDRHYALDHLGLPESFQPSRASAIRLAQTLDADYVILGSFSTTGRRLAAGARVLNMNTLHMSPLIEEGADMPHLLNVLNSLAWRVARHLDPRFAVAQNTFVTTDARLPVGAFEDYVRGLIATDSGDSIRRLKEAVRLDPQYTPSLLALGKAYFASQQYELAAATFGRLPTDDEGAREADFYRGLAYLYVGSYVKAEDAFAFVSRQLPLPEVLNNQGVAASRRGKDATALFLKAAQADPTDADYEFNLAVGLDHKNDLAGALRAIQESLKLQPQDTEAKAFESSLRTRMQHAATQSKTGPPSRIGATFNQATVADTVPLERVKRTFNEASFRQFASEMEEVEAAHLSSLAPAARAARLTQDGTRFLYQGLVLEAEREFQAALEADNSNSGAHAGLAMVRERGGDNGAARQEAEQSLKLKPNVLAYLVLARLDFAANQFPAAAGNVSHALEIEPENSAARGLKQQLAAKGQQTP